MNEPLAFSVAEPFFVGSSAYLWRIVEIISPVSVRAAILNQFGFIFRARADGVVSTRELQPVLAPGYTPFESEQEVCVETRTREEVSRRRFTAHEYHRMGEAGIFGEDERVELIEEVVQMNPIGSRHAACVRGLTRLLGRSLDDELLLDVQNPVRLDGGLEPQPDLAVVRARDYGTRSPAPKTCCSSSKSRTPP